MANNILNICVCLKCFLVLILGLYLIKILFCSGHDYVAYTEIVRQPMSQTQFSLLIHIENFPSFITSKAKYESKRITVNNTEWYIHLNLKKYCQTGKEYIRVPPSSLEQPETLAAFVYGERRDGKECSFDVKATFNFKQPETVDEGIDEEVVAHKFSFCASSTKFNWGLPKLAKIDVRFLAFLQIKKCISFVTPFTIYHFNAVIRYISLSIYRV